MAAAAAAVVLLSLLLFSNGCYADDANVILLQVVSAVEKLTNFYKSSYQDMNLDGIYGLKIVEGQLQRLLEEHKQGKYRTLDSQIITRLSTVLQDAKWTGKRAAAAVKADDQQYYQDMAFLIAEPWTFSKPHRRIVPNLRWEIPVYKAGSTFQLEESESDHCMMEMRPTNTTEAGASSKPRCPLTQHCGLVMTRRGLTEYSITHQILWTAVAENAGCGEELDSLLHKLGFQSIDAMQTEFCTNNYYEMLAIVHVYMSGTVQDHYQDIFLEQQFLCPSLGFFEFLKKKYLDQILSWQLPSGCFGEDINKDSGRQVKKPLNLKFNNLKFSKQMKDVPDVNNLDLKKQQLSDQLKQFKSKEFVKSVFHKQDARKDQPEVHHQQIPKGNMKINPVPKKQSHYLLNIPADKDKNIVVNQGQAQEANIVNTNLQANNQELPLINAKKVDSGPSFLNKNRRLFLQNSVGGLNNQNTGNRPDLNSPGRLNNTGTVHHVRDKPSQPGAVQGAEDSKGKSGFVQNLGQLPDKASVMKLADRLENAAAPMHVHNVPVGNGLAGRRLLGVYTNMERSPHGRRLLVEKEMPGGCLAHKTAVAAGALVMYLRYLVDPGPLDLSSPHHFFPQATDVFLGVDKPHNGQVNFLGNQMEDADENGDQVRIERPRPPEDNDDSADDIVDEEEDEEDDEEDEEYDDKEELYPDTGQGAGQQGERKVVHFGANDRPDEHLKDNHADNQEEEEEYNNLTEDEEEEEEGGDYIKRIKGDDDEDTTVDEDNVDDDTEYTYYDDEDDTQKGIIKRHKPQAPPQKGARIRSHNRHKPHPPRLDQVPMGLSDSPPTKTVVVLLSATSLLLIVFMYRFIRKRRVHIRYSNRGFFRL